jgi:hypothetical protein
MKYHASQVKPEFLGQRSSGSSYRKTSIFQEKDTKHWLALSAL